MFSKHFELDGAAIHVLHEGRSTLPGVAPELDRGSALVFLHEAGSNASVFHRQLAHFAARHSPIAFDLPGHGRSSGTEPLDSLPACAELTLRLIDRLAIESAVLVGVEMGGSIALELSLLAPDRVAALVLVSASARDAVPPELLDGWRRVMAGRAPQPFTPLGYGDGVPFEVMREGWEQQVKTDPRVRTLDLLLLERSDLRPRLRDVRCPALVVRGSKDPFVTAGHAEELAAGIAGARRVEIAGGGHFLHREKPAELHAAIDAFLETP